MRVEVGLNWTQSYKIMITISAGSIYNYDVDVGTTFTDDFVHKVLSEPSLPESITNGWVNKDISGRKQVFKIYDAETNILLMTLSSQAGSGELARITRNDATSTFSLKLLPADTLAFKFKGNVMRCRYTNVCVDLTNSDDVYLVSKGEINFHRRGE